MLVKIASSRPQDILEVLDGQVSEGIAFKYTGKTQGLYVVFDCNTEDIRVAKTAAKKLTKKSPKLGGMTVSVFPY